MAEFKVVAKELERMCNTYHTASGKCGTDECPLYCEDLCYAKSMAHVHGYNAGYLEKVVMTWAAEHPELVYPTWGEWLDKMGVVGLEPSPRYEENYQMVYFCKLKIDSPIPADIAEKLGLQPKEVQHGH